MEIDTNEKLFPLVKIVSTNRHRNSIRIDPRIPLIAKIVPLKVRRARRCAERRETHSRSVGGRVRQKTVRRTDRGTSRTYVRADRRRGKEDRETDRRTPKTGDIEVKLENRKPNVGIPCVYYICVPGNGRVSKSAPCPQTT